MQILKNWDLRKKAQKRGDALSQFINAWFFNGNPDESLSGRSYYETVVAKIEGREVKRLWKIVRCLAEALFFISDKGNHTRLAFVQDIERARVRYEQTRKYIEFAKTNCINTFKSKV